MLFCLVRQQLFKYHQALRKPIHKPGDQDHGTMQQTLKTTFPDFCQRKPCTCAHTTQPFVFRTLRKINLNKFLGKNLFRS